MNLDDSCLLHCQEGRSNKIWGYFRDETVYWAFWCGVGQNPSFKKHSLHIGDLLVLSSAKQRKGYKKISMDELKNLWPEFDQVFQERFVWFKLRG